MGIPNFNELTVGETIELNKRAMESMGDPSIYEEEE